MATDIKKKLRSFKLAFDEFLPPKTVVLCLIMIETYNFATDLALLIVLYTVGVVVGSCEEHYDENLCQQWTLPIILVTFGALFGLIGLVASTSLRLKRLHFLRSKRDDETVVVAIKGQSYKRKHRKSRSYSIGTAETLYSKVKMMQADRWGTL